MAITYLRVVNEQTLNRPILLDKIDRAQGNFEGYAQRVRHKEQIYVPYSNPLDSNVKGYSDLIAGDEVLMQAEPGGSIGGLVDAGRVSAAYVSSTLVATSTLTNAQANTPAGSSTYTGTTFLSVSPDITYLELTDAGGGVQIIDESAFTTHTAVSIVIPDAAVTGTPVAGWKARIFANSKWSNQFTLV
jgi:hypothetical protein